MGYHNILKAHIVATIGLRNDSWRNGNRTGNWVSFLERETDVIEYAVVTFLVVTPLTNTSLVQECRENTKPNFSFRTCPHRLVTLQEKIFF